MREKDCQICFHTSVRLVWVPKKLKYMVFKTRSLWICASSKMNRCFDNQGQ
ncbi:hypothetical protein CLF_103819 [Clonorchis sinensis]|uniref:Uncharacterized protein n=1 Tax=Clonorchis sinensis TaxID=79923 RepID=G7YAG4_CLOSI|nr:hypothetical protein CLF_103819 [Clonorchis sinensis]